MYIDIVPNRNSPPAILLRESYRKGSKIKKRTIANLSQLSMEQAEAIRLILKDQKLSPIDQLFEIEKSVHHGHVQAVIIAMQRLGFEKLIGSRPSRMRNLVVAMVAARIVEPDSKLATARWWKTTTLPEILDVADATEEDLYAAMDWLLKRQQIIEKKLADRHLEQGGQVLYDLTSSYFEGDACPLAARGHNRDKKKGKLQVNYGLLTDIRGCPVSVSVFKGNTADPTTLVPQAEKVRDEFGIEEMILVGDRGMICQKQINVLRKIEGIDWITALRSCAIGKLQEQKAIQLSLFDEQNLFEFTHPDYPGERLIACRNAELARLRSHKRKSLLEATTKELEKVKGIVLRGKIKDKGKIGVRAGKVVNKYKMAKHFILDIEQGFFDFRIDENKVATESALDGIYIVRTSVKPERLNAQDTVRSYKGLSRVERAFRSFKSIDLEVRPIYHWLENRVRAHILLCMLAFYVKWHMMEAWRPLLFADEIQKHSQADPVSRAKRSKSALAKIHSKKLDDGTEAHSFSTLLLKLSTIVRNTCRRKDSNAGEKIFTIDTQPSEKQKKAFELLKAMEV